MKRVSALVTTIAASLLAVSCASLHQTAHNQAQVAELNHIKGNKYTCLSNCVDMVLDYYGFQLFFAQKPGLACPANLLTMDSLIEALGSPCPSDPYKLQSFVLQTDESFLQEQLAHKRPVILIYRSGKDMYHSVVVTGSTADHRAYFVDDPAKSKARWISRGKLLHRWKTTGNTAMLLALAPAGT